MHQTDNNQNISIRQMTKEEMPLAIQWAASEGWNPGLYDANPFFETDPNGYFIAEFDGKPIGCVSAVKYDDSFGFIGFYIVLEKYRGQAGVQLGMNAMNYLQDAMIGIDGVFDKQEKYAKIGFDFAYSNLRFEFNGISDNIIKSNLREIKNGDFEKIEAYDRQHFPTNRKKFLEKWLSMPNLFAVSAHSGEEISGYGAIRSCETGYKIGPLFANDEIIAEDIFKKLIEIAKHNPVYFDIPDKNEAGLEIARKYDMKEVFGTARMYKNGIPELPVNRIFGVTSFELG